MRCALYLRLSNSTDSSTSIERQRAACTSYAEAREFTVVAEYVDDGVSGAKEALKRPGLTQVVNGAQAGQFDVLIVAKLDRLARSVRVFDEVRLTLERHDVELVSVAEALDMTTPAGRMVATVLASFAAFERERTSERVLESQKALAAAGRYSGHRVPYGWRSAAQSSGPGRTLRLDEQKAAHLRHVVELVVAGVPVSKARCMVGEGLPGETSLRKLLRSQTLLGRITRQGQPVTGPNGMPLVAYEPLIDLAQWKALQESLDTLRQPKERTRGLPSLLGGIMTCGDCGKAIMTHTQKRTTGNSRAYRCCSQMLMEVVDNIVVGQFLGAVGRLEVVKQVQTSTPDADALLVAMERRESVRRLFVAGLLSEDEVTRDLGLLNETIALLNTANTEVEVETVHTGQTFSEVWQKADLVSKRGILRGAVSSLTLERGVRGDAERVQLHLG
jgi:site-specific DNA recombinase